MAQTHASEAGVLYEQIQSVEVEDDHIDRKSGGWSAQHKLLPEEIKVFQGAMRGLIGVQYTLVSVAVQIVEGINYRYVCQSITETNPPRESYAMVYVHQALPCYGGEVMITKIIPFLKD